MKEDQDQRSEAEAEIPELRDFDLSRDPEFEGRVWRSIDRRETTGNLVELSTRGPVSLFFEYVAALLGIVSRPDEQGDEAKEE